MRIEYLRMKNFAPPFVALDKTEVVLDYTGNYAKKPPKIINIFIGQMGSCKTFLLGHHQPFATLGNLDVRNSEDMILEGKKGIKEIVYRNGDDLFEITHIYAPSKSGGHTIKSYIKKNGNELNENGNANTFKEIILTEFGLDQSFLKLFRIGSNVINLPDMSSTERKNFISSMISDTEIYALLYRKIGEENRAINAQMTLLINRLHTISNRSEEELQSDMDTESVIIADLQQEIDTATKLSYQLEAEMNALRGNKTAEQYHSHHQWLKTAKRDTEDEIDEIQKKLEVLKDYPSPQSVGNEMVACRAQIEMRNHQIMNLQMKLDQDEKTKNQLRDKLAIMGTPSHVESLKKQYRDLMAVKTNYEAQLKHFTYPGSMGTITTLISEVQALNTLMMEVSAYDSDTIRALLKNRDGALNRAKRALEKAYRDRERMQVEMSNMTASANYTPTHLMVRPFNCPTTDCPYYKYHPYTERQRMNKSVDKAYLERKNQKAKIDATIYLYEDYPNVARKLDAIKTAWNRLYHDLEVLGCLKEELLEDTIINPLHREWFDMKRLNHIKELCGIRDKYYELIQEVAAMRNDLTQYEIADIDQLQRDYDSILATYNAECNEMDQLESANTDDKEKLKKLGEINAELVALESTQAKLKSLQQDLTSIITEISTIEANLEKITSLESEYSAAKETLVRARTEFSVHKKTYDQLYLTVTNIKVTKEQYEVALQRQALIHDVLDAVSSKKGIPLAYVRVFLADCKDIINDLIADVFDDDIEIVDFDIPEDSNEFKIPYTRNGALIDDIVKSSQGERAIISLALSFALIRQRTFPYNIMLLDEVDGPLHRSARNKFITILFKQLHAINAEQVFLVSHNNTFDGYNVNVVMTTNELVDESPLTSIMKI